MRSSPHRHCELPLPLGIQPGLSVPSIEVTLQKVAALSAGLLAIMRILSNSPTGHISMLRCPGEVSFTESLLKCRST